jgi:hypothetical protein
MRVTALVVVSRQKEGMVMSAERNKNRSEQNTTVCISMPKDLKIKAQRLANDRGLNNLSALVRMLVTEETKQQELQDTPMSSAPAGATAAESGGKNKPPTRKCRDGKHCAIPKAVNS